MAESVEQMLQAALYGHEALDVAVQRSASETAQAAHGGERSGEGGEGSTARARQASISVRGQVLSRPGRAAHALGTPQRPDQPVEGGQTCLGCGATSTPEWRRGPMGTSPPVARCAPLSTLTGPRTLCNACGLVYAKLVHSHRLRSHASRSLRVPD